MDPATVGELETIDAADILNEGLHNGKDATPQTFHVAAGFGADTCNLKSRVILRGR